ncbi:putative F-box protein At5g55150 [Chenopodium quinoa]|uniref:putative F-box protein At5g55150 n=1 Tax=Chenopodium quinoa TaxID=63459 RepID=UPI000B779CFC|nr:putative F-box protein At5g55150 [Chenopodium quinoa]
MVKPRTHDWSEMNKDILSLIIKRINKPSDHIRISGVCSSWRSIAKYNRYTLSHPIPGLIITISRKTHHRKFINFPPSDQHYHNINVPCSHRCRGSYYGWLVLTVDNHSSSNSIYLLNPFIKRRRWLPRISENVEKALLSSSPSFDSKCVVLILYEVQGAAFCRVGDVSWTKLHFLSCEDECGFSDGFFFKGGFYVVNDYGKIYTCNLDRCLIKEISSQPSDVSKFVRQKYYLVEIKGELCRVLRRFQFNEAFYYENASDDEDIYDNAPYVDPSISTREFRVCKMDSGIGKWVEVYGLGEYALFLGMTNSICLSLLEVSHSGIEGNKIYFTDDRQRNVKDFGFIRPGNDMGVYDMDYSGIKSICWMQPNWLKTSDPSAVWVAPLPW